MPKGFLSFLNLIQHLLMAKHYDDLIHSENRVGGSSKISKITMQYLN